MTSIFFLFGFSVFVSTVKCNTIRQYKTLSGSDLKSPPSPKQRLYRRAGANSLSLRLTGCTLCFRGYYVVVVPLKKQRGGKFLNPWEDPDQMNLDEVRQK